MIYVSKVVGSVKGGLEVTLGPRTLITGVVGAGKSRIVNAIELATTGRASDLIGRAVVADEAMLLSLAPPDGRLYAEVTLSNGDQARYETVKSAGSKAKKAAWTLSDSIDPDPTVTLPLRPLREAVLGAPDTMRKFFLAHVGAQLSDADVLMHIPAELQGHYRQAIQAVNARAPATDKLLHALELAKVRGREAAAKVKEATATIANGTPSGRPPTEEELSELVKARAAALAKLEEVTALAERQRRRHSEEQEFLVLKEKWTRLQREREEIEKTCAMLQASFDGLEVIALTDFDRALLQVVQFHATTWVDRCLACGGSAPTQTEMQQRLAALRDAMTQTNEAEFERAALSAALADRTFDLQVKVSEIERVEAQGHLLKDRLGLEAEVATAPSDLPVVREYLDTVQAQLMAAEKAKAAWTGVSRIRDRAVSAEREQNEWAQLVDACQSAVRALLDQNAEEFSKRVQLYLPSTDHFALRLRDGEKEVCRFGLLRDEVLHTALSGGEWARVTAALATACARPSKNKLTLIVPEDRGLDPEALATAMEGFSNAPGQVILTSTTRPARAVEGWTILEVGQVAELAVVTSAPAQVPPAKRRRVSKKGNGAEPVKPAESDEVEPEPAPRSPFD